jgi:hypothetical protein
MNALKCPESPIWKQYKRFDTMAGKKRIKPLATVGGCSIEMARLYREARRGETDISEVKGLVWILKTLSGLITESNLEKRIEVLEIAKKKFEQ